MSVIPFSSVDEVVGMSNGNEHGLAAVVRTDDVKKAMFTARALRGGVVGINDSQPAPTELPWGGNKQPGIGVSSASRASRSSSRASPSTSTSADEAARRGGTVAPDLGYAPRSWPAERSSSSIW
jgi:acyl-CoA reductase-like NAD-dependent aldehyde dehydrogenase